MFTHIMVPVDLSERDTLGKAIAAAADQARLYGARMTFVSVMGGLQAKVSHSTGKYARLLAEFAAEMEVAYDVAIGNRVYDAPDPSVEVDRKLLLAIEDLRADLVVMASHQPGWVEYLVNSHGGRLAAHAPVSVFVVRGG